MGSKLISNLLMRWTIFILFSLAIWGRRVSAQSQCIYMKDTPYNLDSVPDEPERNLNLSICTVKRSTCCTTEIESQMMLTSRLTLERSVQDQLILTRQQFNQFSIQFKENFRQTLNETHRKLDVMFSRTYGPFYLQNRQIFDDFFVELDSFFTSDYPNSNVKQVLSRLFRKLYVRIFELLNPLREVGAIERECMEGIQDELKPFGGFPNKMALLMERSFTAWKKVLKVMEKTNDSLFELLNDINISRECIKQISRMQHCHVCTGANYLSRPCPGFCLNVLKGCFAEYAEIDPQWNSLIDSLVLYGTRLKQVYNPHIMLAPIPVQISEAIMYYQEKGTHLSNRIVLQCFAKTLNMNRMKRGVIESVPSISSSTAASNEIKEEDDSESNEYYDDEPRYKKNQDSVKQAINLFVDRLLRMKSFWRSLPELLCNERRISAGPGETCWNGYSMGRYTKRVVGDGIASQLRNPEYIGTFQGSREAYMSERIQFAVLSDQLVSLFYGRNGRSDAVEGSGDTTVASDLLEGSGLPPIDDEDEYNNEINIISLDDGEDYIPESTINNALPSSTASAIRIRHLYLIPLLIWILCRI